MKMGKPATAIMAAAAALGLLTAAPALAAPDGQESAGWGFQITPYVWIVGLEGVIQAGPVSGTIGASFSDILDSLDFGLMGLFQVRKGRLGFAFDGMYARLTKDGTTSGALGEAETVQTEIVSQLYSFMAAYRVIERRLLLDVGLGSRIMPMSSTLRLTSGALGGAAASGSNTAVDGFVGARLEWPFAGRWALDGYADIGAGDSELSWQAMGGLKFRLSGALSLKLGYRYLSIHNDSTDLSSTVREGGFYLGVGIRL